MDELWTLVLLSLSMLVGCYVAGIIPLAFTFSEGKLKLVTVLGAGLLVGTSLAVIIPEAVHTMYSSHPEATEHNHHHHEELKVSPADGEKVPKEGEHVETVSAHIHPAVDTHTAIGISLVVGFIFMLLVDQIGGSFHMHSHEPEALPQHLVQNRHKITATLGLVVHAAADGVALGAAIKTAEAHVTMIVFLAIMLHKAPAAFGLVSFLLHEGFDRPRIRRHLAIFAMSAPVLSLITYFGLSRQSKEVLSNFNATGIAMLFSAGTFLYVATVHVLPEIANMSPPSRTTSPDGTVVVREHKQGFTKIELLAMVTGAVIPVILSLGHSH